MCKFPSLDIILGQQKDELNLVGLETSDDLITSTLQLRLVLQQRVRTLLKAKVIKPGDILRIQVIADASGIFTSTRANGTVVVVKVCMPCRCYIVYMCCCMLLHRHM